VAVLGAGIASYLAEARGRRRRLAHAIRSSGALISEFPPDAPPQKWTFAQRNTTIAALGELTVVVEAPVGSGALITAEEARRLGRPVYAVPGPIGVAASAGANALIATGAAKAIVSPGALLDVLGSSNGRRAAEADDLEVRILDALASSPAGLDVLARRIGANPGDLSARLARLVIRGAVATAPDGRFVRR
jgi:DNA processing protein